MIGLVLKWIGRECMIERYLVHCFKVPRKRNVCVRHRHRACPTWWFNHSSVSLTGKNHPIHSVTTRWHLGFLQKQRYMILLMDKILHQLIGRLSHYVQGFIPGGAGFRPSTVWMSSLFIVIVLRHPTKVAHVLLSPAFVLWLIEAWNKLQRSKGSE